jgi:hypothetical protein
MATFPPPPHRPSAARRVAAVTACTVLLGSAGVAFAPATAGAATIGPQVVLRPPAPQPIEFVGRRYKQGQPIPKGHAIVRRAVTMAPREPRARTRFSCPRGLYVITPGVPESSEVFFELDNVEVAQYRSPHRAFVLGVRPAPPQFIDGPTANGSLYVLCGPKRLAPRLRRS